MLGGGTVARTVHFALHRAALDAPSEVPALALFNTRSVWMGAMVPKRWAKRAVTRNAIKHQIYSVSADFESTLLVAAHVVRLRAGFDRKQFISATSDVLKGAVRQELQKLFASAVPRAVLPAAQVGAT